MQQTYVEDIVYDCDLPNQLKLLCNISHPTQDLK